LQLSLDLFRDLQFSLQPRFHLEIGLVRLVHAGRLIKIEDALAGLASSEPAARVPQAPRPSATAPPPTSAPPAPVRGALSPFDLDRAKKAASRPPEPQSSGANALAPLSVEAPARAPEAAGDARTRLHAHLTAAGLTHLADAVENAAVSVSGSDLNVAAAKSYALYFNDRGFNEAVRQVFGRPLNVKFSAGEPGGAAAPIPAPSSGAADDATRRALTNPEVQRFREVFGGEIRTIRNLKE